MPVTAEGAAAQISGSSVSITLAQDGVELNVSGLPEPVQLMLPLNDPDELVKSCIGHPGLADHVSLLPTGRPPSAALPPEVRTC